jgi:hypothetical protein
MGKHRAFSHGIVGIVLLGVGLVTVTRSLASRSLVAATWPSAAAASPVLPPQSMKRVPIGYAPRPEGTPLRMTSPRTDGEGFATDVTNVGTKPIASLTFVSVLERFGRSPRPPVRLLTSAAIDTELMPGQTRHVELPWLTSEELDALFAETAPDRLQMFLAPSRIRYSDGTEWVLQLDTTANNHMDAFAPSRGNAPIDIPRSLVSSEPAPTQPVVPLCRDDRQRTYSSGASVPIRNEPGHRARCVNGRWIEQPPN